MERCCGDITYPLTEGCDLGYTALFNAFGKIGNNLRRCKVSHDRRLQDIVLHSLSKEWDGAKLFSIRGSAPKFHF